MRSEFDTQKRKAEKHVVRCKTRRKACMFEKKNHERLQKLRQLYNDQRDIRRLWLQEDFIGLTSKDKNEIHFQKQIILYFCRMKLVLSFPNPNPNCAQWTTYFQSSLHTRSSLTVLWRFLKWFRNNALRTPLCQLVLDLFDFDNIERHHH